MSPLAPLHAIDGFWPLFRLFDIVIPTYYPIISLSFSLCLFWLAKRARDQDFEMRLVFDLFILTLISGFLGARLFHVFFEDFEFYKLNPLEILKFWNGGFVFYGGAIAAFVCGTMLLRFQRYAVGPLLNLVAPVAALGYALGRIACFVTGCCFGASCDLYPGFSFRHPTQLYAVLIEFVILAVLLKFERLAAISKNSPWRGISGAVFCLWLILHSLGRLFMEALRADPRGPMPLSVSISSWISIFILISTASYLRIQFKKK